MAAADAVLNVRTFYKVHLQDTTRVRVRRGIFNIQLTAGQEQRTGPVTRHARSRTVGRVGPNRVRSLARISTRANYTGGLRVITVCISIIVLSHVSANRLVGCYIII